MFDEVFTALLLIKRSPERAEELFASLEQFFASKVKAAGSAEMSELMEVIGFAEQSGFDVQPLVEISTRLLSALLENEDPNREKSVRVRRQFQDFTGERAKIISRPSAPPPGAVRLAAIAPPKRRFA